jgi:hypothetical protein
MKTLVPRPVRALLNTLSCLALAATASSEQTTHSCASIPNDAGRLACYDKAFGAPPAPPNSAPAPEQFGLPATESAREETISSGIQTVERRRDGKFVVSLENGQTWQQTELNSRVQLRVGEPVTVRRAALGSYLLSNAEGFATRVKRLR